MLENITKNGWLRWVIIGVILRLVLMATTLHPDLWGHSFTAYFFAYEGSLNPYESLASLPENHPLVKNFGINDIFIYPPLTYFTLGIFRVLIKPFTDPNFLPFVMEFPARVFERSDLFLNLFLYKLPYLFIDVLIAFILSSLFNNQEKKRKAFILWLLNPVSLYATFMIGQIDILPTLFAVLAVYFSFKRKFTMSLLMLGLGASYKMWPALMIIPAALIFSGDLWKRVKFIAIGFLPLILSLIPYVNSNAFRYMVFSPKSQKMLYMSWPVTAAEGIYPFLLILSIIYLIIYFGEFRRTLVVYSLSILLLIFSVTHYHPQWFLWITPFLIWDLVENNFKNGILVLILMVSWFIITLSFEGSLSVGLFNPLYPELVNAKSPFEILPSFINSIQLKSMIRSVFAGASILYVFRLFQIKKSV